MIGKRKMLRNENVKKLRWWESQGTHPQYRLWQTKNNYLGSRITNDTRGTCELKSKTAVA